MSLTWLKDTVCIQYQMMEDPGKSYLYLLQGQIHCIL